MPSSPLSVVVRQLRAAAERDGAGRTDGELLTCFLNQRDEDALAALVVRHAPMVWGVCRRLLRNPHDAEDAFQAAFLVLVRKAATVTPREMVGNWLYGVAHQTAVRLRATAAKRGVREMQMKETPEPAAAGAREDELLSLLDQELSRLPERFRVLIVLCDLEGKTRKEVARRLGCPEGTVASRHARARGMLVKRMARHGPAVSGGALAAVLAQTAASACAPTTVVSSTIKAATLLATGKAVGVISGPVAALTEGVLKAMFLKKIMTTTVMVLALSMAAATFGSLAKGQAEGQTERAERPMDKQPMADKKPMETEKEGFTAWGKEAGGLQAGLGCLPGQHRTYQIGETVALVVRVRNVGKKEVKFSYFNEFFYENPPTVTDGEGKLVPLEGAGLSGRAVLVQVNLPPGKEVKLSEMNLELRPASEKGKERPVWKLFGTGKFQMQHENVGGGNIGTGEIKFDPILSKLATGKLELEVKPEPPPKDDNKGNKPVNPRVSIDKTKATVEGQLDEASTLVLRIGEEKDKLFWEARRKDTPGSAMVRFSEEGAKRFWGDKAQSAGAFKAVVELSDKILMSDGKFATGFIYSVAVSEGAATEKQNLIGSMIYVPIPKTGTLQDLLARSLAGDAMPFGQLSLREESKIVRKDGVVTFADIRKGDGKLVPVSFVMEKSHSSLRRKQTPPAATEKK